MRLSVELLHTISLRINTTAAYDWSRIGRRAAITEDRSHSTPPLRSCSYKKYMLKTLYLESKTS